jgi:hypothetical protein
MAKKYFTIDICFSVDAALIMRIICSLDKLLFGFYTFTVGFQENGNYGLAVRTGLRDVIPGGVLFLSLTTNIHFNYTLLLPYYLIVHPSNTKTTLN